MKLSRHENFVFILISRFFLGKIAFRGILISQFEQIWIWNFYFLAIERNTARSCRRRELQICRILRTLLYPLAR